MSALLSIDVSRGPIMNQSLLPKKWQRFAVRTGPLKIPPPWEVGSQLVCIFYNGKSDSDFPNQTFVGFQFAPKFFIKWEILEWII